MNQQEALSEAKKRWGKSAAIADRKHNTVDPDTKHILLRRFEVGYIGDPIPCFCVEGNGDNWAEAFRDADNRVNHPERMRIPVLTKEERMRLL